MVTVSGLEVNPKLVPEIVTSIPVDAARFDNAIEVTLGESKVKLLSRVPDTGPMTGIRL
jgi:hypothetical protein